MITLDMSGTFSDVKLSESPERAIAVNGDSLTVSGVTVDNSAGSSLGKNTDGFDISATYATISNTKVTNQDE